MTPAARLVFKGAVAFAAVASLVVTMFLAALPFNELGPDLFALGMCVFLLLPLLIRLPSGGPWPSEQGVRYTTGRSTTQTLDQGARLLGLIAWTGVALSSPRLFSWWAGMYGFVVGVACLIPAFVGLAERLFWAHRRSHSITLEKTTLTIHDHGGTKVVAYSDLLDVTVEQDVNRAKSWVQVTTTTDRYIVPVEGRGTLAHTVRSAIVDATAAAKRSAGGAPRASARALEIDELAMRVHIEIVMQPESEDAVAELEALEVEELKQATRE